MKSKEMNTNQITEGVIWKQLLLFFFPILLGTFFQQIYNTADSIVVGRFVGKEALASVGGSSGQIINLVVGFFIGLSSGATVVISQFYGAKDSKNVNYALHTAIAFSLVGSVILSIAGFLSAPRILRLMHTPETLLASSSLYLQIYFGGIIFVLIYNVGSGILRAVGDSKSPLYFLIVCCILNILLDILFVLVLHLDVAGVALATVISQAVSAFLIIRTLMKSTDIFRLRIREIRFHRRTLRILLYIGIPAGLQSVMYNISNVIIQACMNSFGTDTVAAWTAFGKIDAIYWMVSNAFGISITTFIGQNFGARKYDRMKKSVRICFSMAMGTSLLISSVFLLFGNYLFLLFTGDASVVEIGLRMMHFMVPAYFIYVFIEILSGALRGTGDVLIPMLITCGGVCLLRLLWIAIMIPRRHAITTIMFSYPMSWIITTILFLCYYFYRRKQWTAA